MQSYDSDNGAHNVDEGTCSSDGHCVFPSGPHFRGQFTPLYFAKIATALALLNSPDFYLSKSVKMSKWPKSA